MRLVKSMMLLAILATTQATALTVDDIDFERKMINSSFVFAPLKGTTSNSGVFWYTQYDQDVAPPININSSLRKISIRATPMAHADGSYYRFVKQFSALDQRQTILPQDATLCEGNPLLIEKLADLGISYQFDKRIGGYPGLCWFNITYIKPTHSAIETELVAFLQQNKVIDHYYSIGAQNTPSVTMDAQAIVSHLLDSGALTLSAATNVDATRYYTGDFYRIAFETSKMNAALFRSDVESSATLSLSAWKPFMALFSFKLDGTVSVPQQVVEQQIVVEDGAVSMPDIVVDTRNHSVP
jgi:hypothetical protein